MRRPENPTTDGMKKELHLICGERKPDPKINYPCDYNPFCLASVGRIVDQYRPSLAKVKNAIRANGTEPSRSELAPLLLDSLATSGNCDQNDKDGDLRRITLVGCEAIQTHVSRLICDDEGDTTT
mmetsp:Transcript_5616/g.8837  ORF Transcript_5616/g.8837 Transcript_5616/m.8837 type:complete len:125 (-) Transcript_5616:503-877(-)